MLTSPSAQQSAAAGTQPVPQPGGLGGVSAIVALATVLGASQWLAASSFVPVSSGDATSYSLSTLSSATLMGNIGAMFIAIGIAHAVVMRLLFRRPPVWSTAELRYWWPLLLVGSNFLSLMLLWEPARDVWAPTAFVVTDLRSIVIGLSLCLSVRELDILSERTLSKRLRERWARVSARLTAADRSLLIDVGFAFGILAVVLASSPLIRFSAKAFGDEPKYLRYAENWWQGNGMDVSNVRAVSELPPGEPSHLARNLRRLGPEIQRGLTGIAADVNYLDNPKHWGHRFNRATYAGNWTVSGKDGGLYLMHGAGIAAVFLPAYLIDRTWFDSGQFMFADDLFATNLTMLTIFVLLSVAIFRMLETAGATRLIAATVAAAAALSLPLAAFAFPFYPETLAGLIACAAARTIIGESALSKRGGAAMGLTLGFLGWLHIRFLPLSAVALFWVLFSKRTHRQATGWTFVTYGTIIATLCFYTYHVTGSVIPSALYDAEGGHGGFRLHWVLTGLQGLVFDRQNGLLPFAPMYLLAFAGAGTMMTRPRTLLMVLSMMLALFIPVAGHGYQLDGTTPLRHVLAVVPLAAIPIASLLMAVRRRPWWLTVSLIILLLSVRQAVAYDWNNSKTIAATIDSSLSGWDPTLLFPLLRRVDVNPFDGRALVMWELATMGLIVGGIFLSRQPEPDRTKRSVWNSPTAHVATLLAAMAVIGNLTVVSGGLPREERLLKSPSDAWTERQAFDQRQATWLTAGTSPARPGR